MTKNYDQEFGPDGTYAWPGCSQVAEELITVAPYAKSGPECLDDDLFFDRLDHLNMELFDEYPEEEVYKLREGQEAFRNAKNWPLPYLVTSAMYYIFSTDAGRIDRISEDLFWLFLSFDKPLFDILRSKG